MSEEQEIAAAFADFDAEEAEVVDDKQEVEQEVEQEEVKDEPQYSALEQEARDDGHTTKDEWTEAGKDPERWKSAHEFVEYGKIKNALEKSRADTDKLRNDYDKRFENLNKLHKADTDNKIKALKADQRKAVEEADTVAYDEAQVKIEELKVEPEPVKSEPESNKSAEIIAWEKDNDWINNPDDPRTDAALDFWDGYVKRNPNGNNAAGLKYVSDKISQLYPSKPKTNPRRDSPGETSRAPSTPKVTGKISMSDLTPEEKNTWNNTKDWYDSEKDFLIAVKDSRRGL